MARNLYRFYLYIVYIALLIFVAFAVGYLLSTLLAFTPLRGTYADGVPDAANVAQVVVFATIALVIVGGLAGLHYWLIRRDMRNDAEAGGSAIRSFFLNLTEALGIALAVPLAGFFVLNTLASSPGQNVVSFTAFALATLSLVGVLALESRRTQAGVGAAQAFQRLHFYGVQVLLLIFVTASCLSATRPFVEVVFVHNGACSENGGYCPGYNPLLLVISVLWFLVFWLGYGWLVRKDTSVLLRLIVHCLSLAYGIGFILYGLYQALLVLFLSLFRAAPGLSDVVGPGAHHDFFSPFLLGMLVTGVYYGWLRMAARQGLIERRRLLLTEYAIASVLLAGVFWWGCGSLIYAALQFWMPIDGAPVVGDWASVLALLVVGAGYIPLNWYLRRRSSIEPTTAAGPHRGFVLALSGAGILALAIGGAIALYAGVTALFGVPVANWQQVVHGGLAAGIVGAILVGIYLSLALREHLFGGSAKRVAPVISVPVEKPLVSEAVEPSVAPVQVGTIEAVLDELLLGKITRDEAAERIRNL